MPTVDGAASPGPSIARAAENVTQAASAKNETAISLRASRSRASGTREWNCRITTSALDTSMKESSPNPISAADEAAVPTAIATTPSSRLYPAVA